MKTVKVTIDPSQPNTMTLGRIDPARVDATTDADIAAHAAQDDAAAREDAARYVRRVRKRLGLSQADFSARINVPLETVRNWEQGTRQPTGAARALFKIMDKAPELALTALQANNT